MKKYVFTVKDDVCLANNKDANATELIAKLKLYGSVENFDTVVSGIKAEYDEVIASMSAAYEAIASQNLTSDEIALVNTYRANKEEISKAYVAENNILKNELSTIKAKQENIVRQIQSILGK